MNCPVCGRTNPTEARLCVHCATQLSNRCGRCHFENPPGFRFCGHCGFRIEERINGKQATTDPLDRRLQELMPEAFAARIAAERGRENGGRREVTVLFLDLQGFTTFSESHDPESVFERIDRYRHAFVEIIYAYEGLVDKFTGDGMMALFGVPITHENAPERACRAALEMQQALEEINQQVRAESGDEGLQMRIGINTGEVVAGSIGPDLRVEYTVLGDTVNVAQRLESRAAAGTILISEQTYERVADLFDVCDLGFEQLKGRQEPVRTYRLDGLRTLPVLRQHQAGQLPFVGRQRELEMLDLVTERTRNGHGQVVLITGEAGLGKSRLLQLWQEQLNPQIYRVVWGASLSYRQPISYWPFITILQSLFGIEEEDDEVTRWQKLERTLQERVPEIAPGELLPFLAHFLNLPILDPALKRQFAHLAPPQLRQQGFIALRVLLVTLAVQQPLFLVLEDLHWVDSATLDLLLFLMSKSPQVPLTFIIVMRPAEDPAGERLVNLIESASNQLLRIDLTPLEDPEMEQLLACWLSPDGTEEQESLPAPLRHHLLAHADGNPFFLEELLEMWVAQQKLVREGGRWRLRRDLEPGTMTVPASLGALLTARFDRLPDHARRTLQLAAVIGRSFPAALLKQVAQQRREPLPLEEALPFLQAQGLIEQQEPGTGGNQEWRFRHPLQRDTIYQELLRSERRELHCLVGRSMEALLQEGSASGPREDREVQWTQLIAYHYEQAEAWEKALPFVMRAAEQAAARFDNETALQYGRRALRLMDYPFVSWKQRLRLHELLGDLCTAMSDFPAAERHYRSAVEIVNRPELWEARQSAELHRKLARMYERRGNYDEALNWLGSALMQLELDSDGPGGVERARVFNDLGWVFFRRGDHQKAQELAFRSLRLLDGDEHLHEIASACNRLVAIYSAQGQWKKAERFALKSLQLRESLGYQPGIASSCHTMATFLCHQGRWDEALHYVERMLAMSRSTSARDSECEALLLRALLELYKGNSEEALATTQKASRLAEMLDMLPLQLRSSSTLARVLQQRGELREAQLLTLQALESANLLHEPEAEAEGHTLLAEILLSRGKVYEAQAEARQALAIASELHVPTVVAMVQRLLGSCYHLQGDYNSAEIQLRSAGRAFARMNLKYELARTELSMARLCWSKGRRKEAQSLCERAYQTFKKLGATYDRREARILALAWAKQRPVTKTSPLFMRHLQSNRAGL